MPVPPSPRSTPSPPSRPPYDDPGGSRRSKGRVYGRTDRSPTRLDRKAERPDCPGEKDGYPDHRPGSEKSDPVTIFNSHNCVNSPLGVNTDFRMNTNTAYSPLGVTSYLDLPTANSPIGVNNDNRMITTNSPLGVTSASNMSTVNSPLGANNTKHVPFSTSRDKSLNMNIQTNSLSNNTDNYVNINQHSTDERELAKLRDLKHCALDHGLTKKKIIEFNDFGEVDIRETSRNSEFDQRVVNLCVMLNHEEMMLNTQIDEFIVELFHRYMKEDVKVYKSVFIAELITCMRNNVPVVLGSDIETQMLQYIEMSNDRPNKLQVVPFSMNAHFFVIVIERDNSVSVYDSLNEPYMMDAYNRREIYAILRMLNPNLTNVMRYKNVTKQVGSISCGVYAVRSIEDILSGQNSLGHFPTSAMVAYRDSMAQTLYSDLSCYGLICRFQKMQFRKWYKDAHPIVNRQSYASIASKPITPVVIPRTVQQTSNASNNRKVQMIKPAQKQHIATNNVDKPVTRVADSSKDRKESDDSNSVPLPPPLITKRISKSKVFTRREVDQAPCLDTVTAVNSNNRPYNVFDEDEDESNVTEDELEHQLKNVNSSLTESSIDECLAMIVDKLEINDVIIAKTAASIICEFPEKMNAEELKDIHMTDLFSHSFEEKNSSSYKLLIPIRDIKLQGHYAVALYYKETNTVQLCDPSEGIKSGSCNSHLDSIVWNVIKVFQKNVSIKLGKTTHVRCYESKSFIHNGLLVIRFAEALLGNKNVKFPVFNAAQYKLCLLTMRNSLTDKALATDNMMDSVEKVPRENDTYVYRLKEETTKSVEYQKGITIARDKVLTLNKNAIFASIQHILSTSKTPSYALCDVEVTTRVEKPSRLCSSKEKINILFPISDKNRNGHWILIVYCNNLNTLTIYDCSKHNDVTQYQTVVEQTRQICYQCFGNVVASIKIVLANCDQFQSVNAKTSSVVVCIRTAQIVNGKATEKMVTKYAALRNKLSEMVALPIATHSILENEIINELDASNAVESEKELKRPSPLARSRSTTPVPHDGTTPIAKTILSNCYMSSTDMENISMCLIRRSPHPERVLLTKCSLFHDRRKKIDKLLEIDKIGESFVNWNDNVISTVKSVALVISEKRGDSKSDKNKHYYFAGYDSAKNMCIICDTSPLSSIDDYAFLQKVVTRIALILFKKKKNVIFEMETVDEDAKRDPISSQIYITRFLSTFIGGTVKYCMSNFDIAATRKHLANKFVNQATPRMRDHIGNISLTTPSSSHDDSAVTTNTPKRKEPNTNLWPSNQKPVGPPDTPRTVQLQAQMRQISLTTPTSSNASSPMPSTTSKRKAPVRNIWPSSTPTTTPQTPQSHRTIQIYYRALQTLDGCQWLSDEVIMAALKILTAGTRIHVTDSTEFPQFCQTAFVRDQSDRWRLSETTDILIPLFVGSNHWMLCHVDIDRCIGTVYESRTKVSDELMNIIIAFVKTITQRRINITVANTSDIIVQQDSYNCGVITIFHAQKIINGEPTYDAAFDAAVYRRKIERLITQCPYVHIVRETPMDTSDVQITSGDDTSVSISSTPRTRKAKRKNRERSPVNTVDPDTIESLRYLQRFGWKMPDKDLPLKQLQVRLQSLASLRERQEVEAIVIETALKVIATFYKHSSVVVLSPSDIQYYFDETKLNSNLAKFVNQSSNTTFFVPYQRHSKWRLVVFKDDGLYWTITSYHPDGCPLQGEEDVVMSLCASITNTTNNIITRYCRNENMAKGSDPTGTASALYFNAKRYLEDDANRTDISAYSDRAYRDDMANDIINSGIVTILGITNDLDTAIPAPAAPVNYTPPDTDSVDKSCLEFSLFHTELTEEVFDLFVSKLPTNGDYVALPLAAHTASGPLTGYNVRLHQGLLIPMKNEDGSYSLAVVKERKATLYQLNKRHAPAEMTDKVSTIALFYGKQRSRLSFCKNYPKGLQQNNMLFYIASLMYSFSKYSANYVFNTIHHITREVMKCVIAGHPMGIPPQDPSKPEWEYLDYICRKLVQGNANVEGAFSEYEAEVTVAQDRMQRRKVTEDLMRAGRDKPLPDPFILPDQVPCKHCGALYFKGYETPSVCCKNGSIDLKDKFPLIVPTERMRKLKKQIHNSSSEAPYKLLPSINRENAFAHRVVNFKPRADFPRGGTIPLVLNGEYCVSPVALEPCPNNTFKKFTCLNITNSGTIDKYEIYHSGKWNDHDKNEATYYGEQYRDALLHSHPYFDIFKTANELLQEEKAKADKEGRKLVNFLVNIIDPCDSREFDDPRIKAKVANKHKGTLNAPNTEQIIAYIYQYDDGEHPSHDQLNKGIRIYLRSRKERHIHHTSSIRDAALFPLLFPTGAQSYNRDLMRKPSKRSKAEQSNRTNMSRAECYNYITCRRGHPRDLNHWLHGYGAVTAEFELQAYTQIEADRFAFYRKKELELANLMITTGNKMDNFTRKKLERLGYEAGVKIELSKQHPGSRKNLEDRYYSAMALAREFGRPDLFVTFTGNPEWEEIQRMKLSDKEDWQYMPDEVVRVFHAKLKELMTDILERHVLGKVKYAVTSLEFQKRGLPHSHTILKLENPLDTPQAIDAIISAEMPVLPDKNSPDYEKVARYRELLRKNMIHGPCENSTTMGCRKNWNGMICKKKYPHSFNDNTELREADYPNYRRPNNGEVMVFKGSGGVKIATNEHVVPHNPYLLNKYQCHINVEAIAGVMNFRYLFKYIYKGFDELLVYAKDVEDIEKLTDRGVTIKDPDPDPGGNVNLHAPKIVDFNEIDAFVSARYLCQQQAVYHRRGYKFSYNTHNVKAWYVHFENEHYWTYEAGDSQSEIMRKGAMKTSPFLQYMQFMAKNPQHRNLKYIQVCKQFKYVKNHFEEYKRTGQIEKNVAYLAPVHPSDMEKYALYALVRDKAGYTSYNELKGINPATNDYYTTFEEAARAQGIIEDDVEWEKCMELAIGSGTAYTCRTLFATLLANCTVPNPRDLWDRFKAYMVDPDKHQKYTYHQREQRALRHIKAILKTRNKKYKQFQLPEIEVDLALERKMKEDEIKESEGKVADMGPKLNREQRQLATDIIKTLEDPDDKDRLFFLSGSGGCGKTFLYEYLIHYCIANSHNVISAASTGIAATLLSHGLTAHTAFNIPINVETNKTPKLDITKGRGKLLAAADIIIWDEAPMTKLDCFEYVQNIMIGASTDEQKKLPFGGRVVLLGGDWKQILPIVKGNDYSVLDETINNSDYFPLFRQYRLTQNMRLDPGQLTYKKWIESVGSGKLLQPYQIAIPDELLVSNVDELINETYPVDLRNDSEALSKRAILAVRNDTVEEINEKIFDLMPGQEEIFTAITKPMDALSNRGMPIDNQDFIENLNPPELPLHKLKLKIGSVVMLMRNIDLQNKLCNGTKLVVTGFITDNAVTVIKCINLSDPKKRTVFIPRIVINYENTMDGTCFSRRQFPVKLCYAMTINKSQGQTLDFVGMLMTTPVFSHGHLYVALSRVRNSDCIRIYAPEICTCTDKNGKVTTLLRNVVYFQLFDRVNINYQDDQDDRLDGSVYGAHDDAMFDEWEAEEAEAERLAMEMALDNQIVQQPRQDDVGTPMEIDDDTSAQDNNQCIQDIINMLDNLDLKDDSDNHDDSPPEKRSKKDTCLPHVVSQDDAIESDDGWDYLDDGDDAHASDQEQNDEYDRMNGYINPDEEEGEISTSSDSDLDYDPDSNGSDSS